MLIFKIVSNDEWRAAETAGRFTGSAVDWRDGYIHFSSAAQVAETARRHFAGQPDLVLVSVDADALGDALRWEPSRNDELFPHLYGELAMTAVRWMRPLPIGPDGQHVFPDLADSVQIRVTRHIDATPDTVFEAWLDPKQLQRWMFGPAVRDEELVKLENDPRPGGRFSFVVRRQGVEADHVGEYLEVTRPRRLVFTWGIRGASDDVPSRVAIDIAPATGGSDLTLVHDMDPSWADYADRTRQGWTTMLDKLASAHPFA